MTKPRRNWVDRQAHRAAVAQEKAEETLAKATVRLLERRAKLTPRCAECGEVEAVLVGGDVIYGHRPDLSDKLFWRCPCGAYVGCHKGTERPMGFPAGSATQAARRAAHAALDPLWEAKMKREGVDQKTARAAAYKWMGQQLGLAPEDMHIGMMDRATAERVVLIIQEWRARPRTAQPSLPLAPPAPHVSPPRDYLRSARDDGQRPPWDPFWETDEGLATIADGG